jgi:hypothetical protein
MAFTRVGEFVGKAIEKGLPTGNVKVADFRWTDYGGDNKKATVADNSCVGAVAYVKIDDPKTPDIGTVMKIFFNCSGEVAANRYVVYEVTEIVESPYMVAQDWVGTVCGKSLTQLAAMCPTTA